MYESLVIGVFQQLFLQTRIKSKLTWAIEDAEAFGLPYLVWWFVAYGELGAGVGGLLTFGGKF